MTGMVYFSAARRQIDRLTLAEQILHHRFQQVQLAREKNILS